MLSETDKAFSKFMPSKRDRKNGNAVVKVNSMLATCSGGLL